MNERRRLEQILQQQRLQLFFASRLWLEALEENDQLRQTIAELQARLETHGIPYETATPSSDDQLSFTFEAIKQPAG